MKVDEVIEELQLLSDSGKGCWPVALQLVQNGLTFGRDIAIEIGDPEDGEIVWIIDLKEIAPGLTPNVPMMSKDGGKDIPL